MSDEIKYKTLRLDSTRADDEKRTVEASLSSEEPYESWAGKEVLSHEEGAVDLSRSSSMNLLWNHNTDIVLGVVEGLRLAGRKLRGVLRFGSSQRAAEAWEDVRSGILKNVSIGYMVDKQEPTEDGGYRAVKWTLLEASLVAVPADATVGIGRSKNIGGFTVEYTEKNDEKNRSERRAEKFSERDRVTEILAIGEKFKMDELARAHVAKGTPMDEFRAEVMVKMGTLKPVTNGPEIGMSRREVENYSFMKVLRAQLNKDWGEAGLEREASKAVEKLTGRIPQGVFVPSDVLSTRTLSLGSGGSGGYMKGIDHLGDEFIELLRNSIMVRKLGARVMSGLVGDLAIPRQGAAGNAYWVAEGSDATLSTQTLEQVTLAPKSVAGRTQYTRKFMLQSSPDAEQFVRSDLANILGIEIDRVAIEGSGASNQPTGILNTTGIGDVVGGTNGAAPTWDHIVDLEGEVAVDNADVGGLAYLTNSSVRKTLKKTTKVSGDAGAGFVWGNGNEQGFGMLNSYRAGVSNNVPADLTKGSGSNLSAIIHGNFADLIIGQWGVLDLLLDPFALAASGGSQVVAFQDIDVAVRHPESFAVMQDAVTT